MNVRIFCHSLLSDWNHGNAHFLRGIVWDLKARGHDVRVFEEADSWSLTNLLCDRGIDALKEFKRAYPGLETNLNDPVNGPIRTSVEDSDLVLVHEWTTHKLVREIGEWRKKGEFKLLFHDTHHRAVTEERSMAAYDLSNYDGVLAFGNVIRDLYLRKGWAKRAWTWHEAADPRVFHPMPEVAKARDLVWVGNWGDEERTEELHEFLLEPVEALGLEARVYGVRYPDHALQALKSTGIEYGGSLSNFDAPRAFAEARVTVHVPRRPYVRALPGIPTIRPFEALACGIPLVSAPWNDAEGLFTPGEDYLVARDGAEMRVHLRRILDDPAVAAALAAHGRQTVLARHTVAHRVDELLAIFDSLTPNP